MKRKLLEKIKRKEKKIHVNETLFLDKKIDFSHFKDTKSDTVFQINICNKPQYISLLKISGIDIFNYTDSDMNNVFSNFAKATITLRHPHKYVFTSSKPNFDSQIDFLNYKFNQSEDSYIKAMLRKKINELSYFENNHKDRMAYLIVFGDNITELNESSQRYKNAMKDTNVRICNSVDAISFFNKYLCFDTDLDDVNDNLKLNDMILPDEIDFMQNCIKINQNKYSTSLVVYNYPAYISDLELAYLISTYSDTTITLDVMQRNKQQVKEEVSRSLDELNSREAVNHATSESIDNNSEFQKLAQLYSDLSQGKEQMFYTTLRFIITANDLKSLQKKTIDIAENLEGINSYIPFNQMKTEFINLVDSKSNIIQTPFPLYDSYSRQYPFYYQSHCDPKGTFLGYTDTHGLNVLDTFYRNTSQGRNSYDMLLIGLKGGGKSVTLRSMLEDEIILGNRVMVLDVESEYSDIAKIYHGQVVKMNQHSIINPLQIRMTIDVETENVDTDDDNKIKQQDALAINFTLEISRICTFLYQFAPSITDEQMSDFRDIIIEVFKTKGITNQTQISNLHPRDFPIFTDVYNYVRKKQLGKLTDMERENLKRLETTIKQLTVNGAYSMFDNYTNVNIDDNNLIVFDVQHISELDTNVYNAHLFNILTLMWAEICKNREHNKLIENEYDRRYVVCLIDEAHRFISTKYPQVTEFIEKLLRRTRKYDAALWFASQSIIDFISGGKDAEKIKVIFELVQYKVIMLQDPGSLKLLKEVFNQFTLSELESSTTFTAGEMLMAPSSSHHKIHCRKYISDSSMLYCGNAQDRIEITQSIFNSKYYEHSYAEYGQLLLQNKNNEEYFKKTFTEECLATLGFSAEDSEYLTLIIKNMVSKLCNQLMNKAKELFYEK